MTRAAGSMLLDCCRGGYGRSQPGAGWFTMPCSSGIQTRRQAHRGCRWAPVTGITILAVFANLDP
ncbi:hypothetical protein E2562_034736 [Oryza meyeriana var. granulata]|uniref:Uncharacterized protein n=1 Tax=Oryza meyeriana var. granulata TaxID=110450 RepID=A0A6G1BQE2_9ORYZ|nr:hypothetical protein E2562_034736 [Oryza meyeriana var. granulata]